MRNLSFSLTTRQILDGTKTVTRRVGWAFLKPGDLLQAIEKGQGLKKGETVNRLRVIKVLAVTMEPLQAITADEVVREGFPEMSPEQFIKMFCATHTIPDRRLGPPRHRYRQPFPMLPVDTVTRIEFEYVEQVQP